MTTLLSLTTPTPSQGAGAPRHPGLHIQKRALLRRAAGSVLPITAEAPYAPGLGYYRNGTPKLGPCPRCLRGQGWPRGGQRLFVTAPELSRRCLAGTLARQVAQALRSPAPTVWEPGAGTGAGCRSSIRLGEMGVVCAATHRGPVGSSGANGRPGAACRRGGLGRALPAQMQAWWWATRCLDAMPVKLLARVRRLV